LWFFQRGAFFVEARLLENKENSLLRAKLS